MPSTRHQRLRRYAGFPVQTEQALSWFCHILTFPVYNAVTVCPTAIIRDGWLRCLERSPSILAPRAIVAIAELSVVITRGPCLPIEAALAKRWGPERHAMTVSHTTTAFVLLSREDMHRDTSSLYIPPHPTSSPRILSRGLMFDLVVCRSIVTMASSGREHRLARCPLERLYEG